jgi:hypothetical protein
MVETGNKAGTPAALKLYQLRKRVNGRDLAAWSDAKPDAENCIEFTSLASSLVNWRGTYQRHLELIFCLECTGY